MNIQTIARATIPLILCFSFIEMCLPPPSSRQLPCLVFPAFPANPPLPETTTTVDITIPFHYIDLFLDSFKYLTNQEMHIMGRVLWFLRKSFLFTDEEIRVFDTWFVSDASIESLSSETMTVQFGMMVFHVFLFLYWETDGECFHEYFLSEYPDTHHRPIVDHIHHQMDFFLPHYQTKLQTVIDETIAEMALTERSLLEIEENDPCLFTIFPRVFSVREMVATDDVHDKLLLLRILFQE